MRGVRGDRTGSAGLLKLLKHFRRPEACRAGDVLLKPVQLPAPAKNALQGLSGGMPHTGAQAARSWRAQSLACERF